MKRKSSEFNSHSTNNHLIISNVNEITGLQPDGRASISKIDNNKPEVPLAIKIALGFSYKLLWFESISPD